MAKTFEALNKNVISGDAGMAYDAGNWQNINLLSKRELAVILQRISFLTTEKSCQVFNFTSSQKGEGTSSILVNLVRYFSKIDPNKKMLLIDANFDRAIQHIAFNKKISPGLCEILQQNTDYLEAIQTLEEGYTYLVSRGSLSGSKSFEFSEKSIPKLIDQLKKDFSYILIDSPAVLESSNSLHFARHADTTFMVARAFNTRYEVIEKAKTLLLEHQAIIDGVILNRILQPIPGWLYNKL